MGIRTDQAALPVRIIVFEPASFGQDAVLPESAARVRSVAELETALAGDRCDIVVAAGVTDDAAERLDGMLRCVAPDAALVRARDPNAASRICGAIATALAAVRAEARPSLMIDRGAVAAFRSTPDGRVLEANPALARLLGCNSPEDVLSRRTREFYFSEADRHAVLDHLRQAGSLRGHEIRLKRLDGSAVWAILNVHLSGTPGAPVIEGTLIEITDRKRAEARALEMNRLFSVLSQLNQAIVRIGDPDALLREVCRIAVEFGGFRLAWFGKVDQATGLLRPVAFAGHEDGYFGTVRISVGDDPCSRGPMGSALRDGQVYVANDIASDHCTAPWREQALIRGYRSCAAFPVRVQGRLAGAYAVYAEEPLVFDGPSVQLLREMAEDISFALENIDRERQRKQAEEERATALAREQAAQARAKAEARFRELLEAAPDAILEIDYSGGIRIANHAAERLFGYRGGELLGRNIQELLPGKIVAAWARGPRDGASRLPDWAEAGDGDLRIRRQDGTEVSVEVRLSPVLTGEGELITCILRDITARRRAEEALRDTGRRVSSILESITDAFFAVDRDWRLAYLNGKAMQWLDQPRDAVLGKTLWEVFPQMSAGVFGQHYRRTMADRTPADFTAFYQPLNLWAEVHVYPSESGISVYIQDITARKQLEEQFRQSQRLESLGRLAGGVAHDFNNLLTIIGGYAQMLLDAIEPPSRMRGDVEAIIEAADRASGLTRHLLAFSRRQVVRPKILDLNRVLTRMHRMLRPVIGEDIELRMELAHGLPRIKTDPGQLEQVVMNLVVNARDAMTRGGILTIATGHAEIREGGRGEGALPTGSYVTLAITDTGTGMEPEIRNHIFEPFFTTKPRGKGTGLGLSTVYGIVKQNGGDIQVESDPGSGSTFRILFPPAEKPRKVEDESSSARAPRKGTETILLVEDETEVRRLTREMLARLGYRVLDAACGSEALRIWEDHRETIALVLTDVIMPQMSGQELAAALAERRPGIKILFMSGYTDEVIARHGVMRARMDLLQKPFTREALALKVRSVIDGSSRRSRK